MIPWIASRIDPPILAGGLSTSLHPGIQNYAVSTATSWMIQTSSKTIHCTILHRLQPVSHLLVSRTTFQVLFTLLPFQALFIRLALLSYLQSRLFQHFLPFRLVAQHLERFQALMHHLALILLVDAHHVLHVHLRDDGDDDVRGARDDRDARILPDERRVLPQSARFPAQACLGCWYWWSGWWSRRSRCPRMTRSLLPWGWRTSYRDRRIHRGMDCVGSSLVPSCLRVPLVLQVSSSPPAQSQRMQGLYSVWTLYRSAPVVLCRCSVPDPRSPGLSRQRWIGSRILALLTTHCCRSSLTCM